MRAFRSHHIYFYLAKVASLLLSIALVFPPIRTQALNNEFSGQQGVSPTYARLTGITAPTTEEGGETPKPNPGEDTVEIASTNGILMPGSPLEIIVYSDGSLSLQEAGRNHFYGSRASGFFLWIGNAVYGPSVPAGGSHIAYTNIAHQGPFGSGTAADPWRVISTFQAGTPELTIQQVVAYVNGARHIDFWWQLVNTGGNIHPISLFHAADLYVDGNDYGRGYRDQNTRAVGGYNVSSGIYGIFTPITAPDAYEENSYGTIWSRIGGTTRGIGLQNSIRSDYIDNGAGLQWNLGRMAASAHSIVTSRFSVTPQNTSTPALEAPPTVSSVQSNRLPDLREFEFGVDIHISPERYSSGAIDFSIPIGRYYGSYRADRATLTVRAFDVDSPNERYTLKVNNRLDCNVTGELRGVNGGWRSTSFSFDTRCLNLPILPIDLHAYQTQAIPSTVQIQPAGNAFQLTPVASSENYKTLVSYAQLQVQGTRPVLFGHGVDLGLGSAGCTGNTRALGRWEGWVYGSNLPSLGALVDGSRSLAEQIRQWGQSYTELRRVLGLRDKDTQGVAEPDRIIAVGYSMGGLAGRGFVNLQHSAGNYVVENFVDFTTPNDGNDLSGIGSNFGCSGNARHDLSSSFVRDTFNPQNNLTNSWNYWRNFNGSTIASQHMTSIAARYGIRANDGVVWVDEVHVLPYDRDTLYRWDDDADDGETEQPDRTLHEAVVRFASMMRQVFAAGNIGTIVPAVQISTDSTTMGAVDSVSADGLGTISQAFSADVALSETSNWKRQLLSSFTGNLPPDSEATGQFRLDEVSYLAMQPIMTTQTGTITYTLTAPSGTKFPTEAASLYLESPEAGLWTVEILGGSAGGDYGFALATGSDLAINLLPSTESQRNVIRGVPVAISIDAQDNGIRLPGLSAIATIQAPDGQTIEVVLNDQGENGDTLAGDGIYSVGYPTGTDSPYGTHIVSVSLQGNRADGRPFQRVEVTGFTLMEGTGFVSAPVDWVTEDTNGDTLIDVVIANVLIAPSTAGVYQIVGNLQNNVDGSIIAQGASEMSVSSMQVGTSQLISLRFDGGYLGGLGTALNLSIVDLKLYYVDSVPDQVVALTDGGYVLIDYRSQVDGSLSLASTMLQEPLLRAAVDGYTLLDANNNSRAEALRFDIDIFSRFGSGYTLQATLQDSAGNSIAFTEQGLQLGSGWQRIPVDFTAAEITRNGVAGPFILSNLSVLPIDPTSQIAGSLDMAEIYTTAPLSLDDFEGFAHLSIGTNVNESQAYIRVSPANPDNIYPTSTEVVLEPIITDPDIAFGYWDIDGAQYHDQRLQIVLNGDMRIDAVFGHPQLSGSASPASITANGASQSVVTFVLNNSASSGALSGRVIYVSTTLGVLDAQIVTTTMSGNATVILTSGTQLGIAMVKAVYKDAYTATVQITTTVGAPAEVSVIAAPTSLLADGASTATLTAVVKDANGNPVPSQTVVFATTLGAITNAAVTDANGAATATLTSVQEVGAAQVTASLGSLSASTEVTFAGSMFAGVVFVDRNQNGVRDAGEPGIPNVTAEMTLVSLAASSEQAATAAVGATWRTVSDAEGNYRFTDLPLGEYTLTLYFPRGYAATTPTTYTVTVGTGQGAAPEVGALVKVYLPSVRR